MTNLFKTPKQAEAIVHSLSSPSKMPCYGYSIPARHCITGGKLHKVKQSICSVCYALKGRYVFPNVLAAMEKRFSSLHHVLWEQAITYLIRKREKSGFFRWHDSGDIQSENHLDMLCKVARNLPDITFWLPTREYSIVSGYMEKHSIPDNLTIRLSAFMIDGEPPVAIAKRLNLVVSGVSKEGFNCPSSKQNGKCMDCRACWSKEHFVINYKQH
jgi:hypothetical protein